MGWGVLGWGVLGWGVLGCVGVVGVWEAVAGSFVASLKRLPCFCWPPGPPQETAGGCRCRQKFVRASTDEQSVVVFSCFNAQGSTCLSTRLNVHCL